MTLPCPLVQSTYASPLGPIVLAASSKGLAGLWFENQRYFPDPSSWPINAAHPVLQQTTEQLNAYFAGQSVHFDVPLDLQTGTVFQRAVWQALTEIDPGTTLSYSALSQRLGKPQAVRAVGSAVGRNPISIIVPCHRVIGSSGQLTGYAGGLDKKTALLALEKKLALVEGDLF